MKNAWVIIGIIAVALIGGSVVYSNNVAKTNNEGVSFTPHVKGNAEATVTLVEFSDFQCPACQSFQPILTQVLEEFGDRIAFEYKHFPLPIHALAEPAARAAEAAGQQDAFFAYHDKLFENQKTWSTSPNPTALFIGYAQELGLDVDTFRRHYNASVVRDKVKAEGSEARELGFTGTPTFLLNGQRMQITTFEDFYNQIKAAVEGTTVPGTAPAVQFGI